MNRKSWSVILSLVLVGTPIIGQRRLKSKKERAVTEQFTDQGLVQAMQEVKQAPILLAQATDNNQPNNRPENEQPNEQPVETEQAVTVIDQGAAEPEQEAIEAESVEATESQSMGAAESPSTEQPSQAIKEESSKAEQATQESAEVSDEEMKKLLEEPKQNLEQVKIDEIEGIDTVDLDEPQGNWLFKRIWWHRAEEKYEKIKALVASIFDMRLNYFLKRDSFEKNVLTPFYLKNGLHFGELEERVKIALEAEQAKNRTTKEDELRADLIVTELKEQEQHLQQVSNDVTNIIKLDESLDQAVTKLMEQLDRVRSYEQEAWKNFKDIARVLDDKKARALYFNIEVALQNIKEIQNYLSTAFDSGFNKIISTTQTQINRIQTGLEMLKAKGIDLIEQIKQPQDRPVQPVVEEEEEEEPVGFVRGYFIDPVSGLLTSVWDGVAWVAQSLYDVVMWPVRLITGGTAAEDESEQEEPAVEVVEETEVVE